jgi:hypothetical protein
MGGSSSKKKQEEDARANEHPTEEQPNNNHSHSHIHLSLPHTHNNNNAEKHQYEGYIAMEPAELGKSIPPEHVKSFITRLVRADNINTKRMLVYCNYIISGNVHKDSPRHLSFTPHSLRAAHHLPVTKAT